MPIHDWSRVDAGSYHHFHQAEFDRVELYEHDVAMLMRAFEPDLSIILKQLSQYLSESDLGEVRDILHEIEQRLARAPHRFRGSNTPIESEE